MLLDSLKDSAVPHEYLTFAGEGHGFRLADTIVACLEAELALYHRAFGIARVASTAGEDDRSSDVH